MVKPVWGPIRVSHGVSEGSGKGKKAPEDKDKNKDTKNQENTEIINV